MNNWKKNFQSDRYRNSDRTSCNFMFFFRMAGSGNMPFRFIGKIALKVYKMLYGLEIYCGTNIGKGFYIGHPWGITINPEAIIGDNCNIHKGAVIGRENRGKRDGTPRISNCVWIGINAAVVGNITIGDDVLIAPNSYVNCDVPSHSVVFGNPCTIKQNDKATEGYINKKV